jgi:hypothetical protein
MESDCNCTDKSSRRLRSIQVMDSIAGNLAVIFGANESYLGELSLAPVRLDTDYLRRMVGVRDQER